MTSSPPLLIELRPSRAIGATLLLLAVLASGALLLSAAPIATLLVVPALLALAWPRRPAHGWNALVLRGDGSASASVVDGDERDVVPLLLQRRGPLTVLTLETQGRMHTHLFTPGTLAPDAQRRLGLWFERHAGRQENDGSAPRV